MELTKFIRIRFPDGDWDVPAEVVARDRAKFYAIKDVEIGSATFDEAYKSEFAFSMSDDDELTDWVSNNMNWEDVKAHAVHVKPLTIDYEDEWANAEKQVVEREAGSSAATDDGLVKPYPNDAL